MSRSKGSRRAVSLGLLVGVIAVLTGGVWLRQSHTYRWYGAFVRAGATRDSVVALTFDDGPTPEYTDSVLAILAGRAVHATFYVIGKQVAEAPDLARRIAAAGHELGNHSYSHHALESLLPSSARGEIETTDSLIQSESYGGPITFRPPYGRRRFGLLWYLARTERTIVLWTLDPDTHNDRPDRIVRQALDRVRPGAILLLHVEAPIRTASRAALPILIDSLRARGYRLVTVGELLRLR